MMKNFSFSQHCSKQFNKLWQSTIQTFYNIPKKKSKKQKENSSEIPYGIAINFFFRELSIITDCSINFNTFPFEWIDYCYIHYRWQWLTLPEQRAKKKNFDLIKNPRIGYLQWCFVNYRNAIKLLFFIFF